jgi:hypothetical protein
VPHLMGSDLPRQAGPSHGGRDQVVDRSRRHRSPGRLAEQPDQHEIGRGRPGNGEPLQLVCVEPSTGRPVDSDQCSY